MAGLHLTYMLLPSFSFPPDGDIQLGTLLVTSNSTKLPDPSLPLIEAKERLSPGESSIKYEVEEPGNQPWRYSRVLRSGVSGGFSFEVPFISAFSAGLGVQTTNSHDLTIECRRVETSSFIPSKDYISDALKHEMVKQYASRHVRPSVFMVTGIKVAYDVKIDIASNRTRESSGKLRVDLTSFNAPIKIGPDGQHINDHVNSIRTEKPGRLILAYQLKRIRVKRAGSFSASAYDRHAILFDDMRPVARKTTSDDLDERWDIEDMTSETELKDLV